MNFDVPELKLGVESLAFDVYHYRCYSRLQRERVLARCPTISQGMNYTLLIHLRVIVDFFFKPAQQDDLCVSHFTDLPGFNVSFPLTLTQPKPERIHVLINNLNKLLAHLTATRWRETRPGMDFYEGYVDEIESLLWKFQAALPDDVKSVFIEKLDFWERQHPIESVRILFQG
jgi:hypothetical protein